MGLFTLGVVALVFVVTVGDVTVASRSRRCKYDKKGVEWSPCDPVLHVKSKTVPLQKGKEGCPKTKALTKPCKAGKDINGCRYVPVSSWSDCDPVTLTSTRTLELQSGESGECDNNELESRDCGMKTDKGKDVKRRKEKKKRKHDRKHLREKKKGERKCRYKKGKWGECDPVVNLKVRTLELKKGVSSCDKSKKQTKKCDPNSKKDEDKESSKKKNKTKRKKKKHRTNDSGIYDDVPPQPPKLTEMRVWPLSTSVEVSWTPPDHGTIRGYMVGYGISIPDVYTLEVNASVLHYTIHNLEPEQEYIVSLRAKNRAGFGSPLYETVRTGRAKDSGNSGQLLLAPVEVSATTVSANAIEISWSDSSVLKLRGGVEDSVAKTYTVRYMQLNHLSQDDKPKFVSVNTSESSLIVEGLMHYTRYEFAVRVSQGSSCSVWSLSVINTTFPSAPSSKPADFTADLDPSDPTTVKLTWQPPEEPNGPITVTNPYTIPMRAGYVIFYSKDPILPEAAWATSVIKGNRLSTLIKDLDPNAAYFFKIQARNSEGVGPTTSPVTVTVPDVLPSVPRNFSSFGLEHNPSAVMLRWQRPEKVLEPITGYVITYTDDPNLPEQSWVVHGVRGDHLNNTITDLRPNAKYFFKLQAKNKAGFGPPTNPISYVLPDVAPSVPRNLTVKQFTQVPEAAIIEWLPPLNMGEEIIGYLVMYSEGNSGQWTAGGIQGETKNSLILRGLQLNTAYQFKVRARTESRLGPASPTVRYITPGDSDEVSPPTDLKVNILSSTSAIMSWRNPVQHLPYPDMGFINSDSTNTNTNKKMDDDNDAFAYSVRYGAISTNGHVMNYTYLSPPFFPSLYLVDLVPNTRYEFSVRLNKGDKHSAWSLPVVNTTLEAAPGTPPFNITVNMVNDDPSVAKVTWNPPLRSNGIITGYLVFSSTHRRQPIGDWPVEAVRGEQTSLTVIDLAPSTKYFFKVQARNAKGYGPLSVAVSYKTPKVYGGAAEDVTVRTAPDDPYSVVISWQPPSKTKGKRRIKHYMVVRTDVESEESERTKVPGDTLSTVSHQLLPARSYRFTVQPRYRHSSGPHSKPVDYVVPKELIEHEE